MGNVVASASMSLDGYIAKADNTIGHLFDWFDSGDVEFRTINPDITLHLNRASTTGRNWCLPSVPSCAGGRCSTSPTGGEVATRWTSRWSS
jgi:hypothetical protein